MSKASQPTTMPVAASRGPNGTPSRRSFLALIDGSLATGGSFIAGTVQHARAATAATLLLPPELVLAETASAADHPLLDAMLDDDKSQMHAVIECKRFMPEAHFRRWLESGLRQARMFNGRDEAAMELAIDATVAKHGSITAAMRAGAI